MDKMRMETPGLAANVEKIGALFPNCITETTDENEGLYTQVIDDDLHVAYNNFFMEIHNNSISATKLSRDSLGQLLEDVLSIPKLCFVNKDSSKSEGKFPIYGLGIPHFRKETYC